MLFGDCFLYYILAQVLCIVSSTYYTPYIEKYAESLFLFSCLTTHVFVLFFYFYFNILFYFILIYLMLLLLD